MAAHWANYTWDAFQELEGSEQSHRVGAYRCFVQMNAVLDHERAKEIARQARRRGKK